MAEGYSPCKYLQGGLQGAPPKCMLIQSKTLGPGDHVQMLTRDYILRVCNNDAVAGKVCPHYDLLRKAEGIAKRLTEISEETNGLATRLSG